MALFSRAVLPAVVGRQVKAAGAARDADAAANAHQPVNLGQGLAGLAGLGVQRAVALVQLLDDVVQHVLRNGWVVTQVFEHAFVAIKIAQQVGLEVSTGGHVHDFEHGGQCEMVINGRFARDEFKQTPEESFQTQVGA